ncbi:MAG: hypothetical protein ABL958_07190 [Bdellovibrionia bacterium]
MKNIINNLKDLFLMRTSLPLKEALFATAAASLLTVTGMTVNLMILSKSPAMPMWPISIGMVTSVLVLSVLLTVRNRLPLWSVSVLFMLNTFAVATTFFILSTHWPIHDPNWIPFQPNKLGCLVVGLLAPSLYAGVLGLLLHAGGGTLLFLTFSPQIRAILPASEPFTLWVFAMSGFCVLIFRMRSSWLQQAYTHAQAEVVVAHRLARSFFQLRELMNSPMQTLDFSIGLLKEKSSDNEPIANRMSQALNRLRAINEVLDAHERKINWAPEKSPRAEVLTPNFDRDANA